MSLLVDPRTNNVSIKNKSSNKDISEKRKRFSFASNIFKDTKHDMSETKKSGPIKHTKKPNMNKALKFLRNVYKDIVPGSRSFKTQPSFVSSNIINTAPQVLKPRTSSSPNTSYNSGKLNKSRPNSCYMVNEKGRIMPVLKPEEKKGILKRESIVDLNRIHCHSTLHKKVSIKTKARPKHRNSFVSKAEVGTKKFRFNEFVVIFETYNADDYDRSMTNDLENNLKNTLRIKTELNEFKREEMNVHKDSKKFTHFLAV